LIITKECNTTKIAVFRDSMMIVWAIIKRIHIENIQLNGIIYQILSLGSSFVEFKIYRCWPLTKFCGILGHIWPFLDFDSLSKMER
jgi:hypothetical protein